MIMILNLQQSEKRLTIENAEQARTKRQSANYWPPQLLATSHIPGMNCFENHELCLGTTDAGINAYINI
jgi:hypothetical protein